jgi:hypothetical protein
LLEYSSMALGTKKSIPSGIGALYPDFLVHGRENN